MVTINRNLNLVIPVDRDDGTTVYVHSAPIRTETFETYYLVMSKTWASFMQNGLDPRISPSVASLTLKQIAKETARGPGLDWWEGPDGVGGERGLIAEMVRLSNVVVPSDANGWGLVPMQQAVDDGLFDAEEKKEVLNLLAFFTLISHLVLKRDREGILSLLVKYFDVQTTSSTSTEWVTSLRTQTIEESSGEKSPA